MKKTFALFALFIAVLFISGCGRKIAVNISGIHSSFLYNAKSQNYTFLIPEKQSKEYILFMSKMPYILYALYLNGYKFQGFNISDPAIAPVAIAVFLKHNRTYYFSAPPDFNASMLTPKKSIKKRNITFVAFDNTSKEVIWSSTLWGWGGIINTDETFETLGILSIGWRYIGKEGSRLITEYPRLHSDKYKRFIKESKEYFNMLIARQSEPQKEEGYDDKEEYDEDRISLIKKKREDRYNQYRKKHLLLE